MTDPNTSPPVQTKQPIFMMPGVVTAMIGLMLAIQAAQIFVLDEQSQLRLAVWFGFIPLRLTDPTHVPGGLMALIWTPITHAFLHAGWEHVLLNSAWLAIFGVPVARRYGSVRFLVVFCVSAIAGAAVFALFLSPELQILIGASGGVSGLTGIAMRFVFQPIVAVLDETNGTFVGRGRRLASWPEMFTNGRARTFVIVWIALNALVPFLPGLFGGFEVQIAWQAHLGGFAAGLLIAPVLDRSMRGTNTFRT